MPKYVALLLLISILLIPSASANSQDLALGTGQNFLEFLEDPSGSIYTDVKININGGKGDHQVKAEIVDLMIEADGTKAVLPLGSTPFSPIGRFNLSSYRETYRPNGANQTFQFKIYSDQSASIKDVVSGGVRITVSPTNPRPGNAISRGVGLVLTFIHIPKELEISQTTNGVNNFDIRFSSVQDIALHRLFLPEIPRIVSSGPIQVTYTQKNTGNVFQIVTDTVRIRKIGGNDYVFQSTLQNRLLLPDQEIEKGVSVMDRTEKSQLQIDPLGWGIFKLELNSSGRVGGQNGASAKDSLFFIIFPWKHFLLSVIAIFFLFKLRPKLVITAQAKKRTLPDKLNDDGVLGNANLQRAVPKKNSRKNFS